jgi:hypothetical protein
MSPTTEERIATTGLLIEREAAYARVAEIEAEINGLLRGKYPFPTPEEIPPSLTKRKPKKAAQQKPPKSQPIKLRRLKDDECAYRYRWLEKGAERQACSIHAGLIENFIKTPPAHIRILAVETVDIDASVQDTLHEF